MLETFSTKIDWTIIELEKQRKDETIGIGPQSRFKTSNFSCDSVLI